MGLLGWAGEARQRRAAAEEVAARVDWAWRRNDWRSQGDSEADIAATSIALGWSTNNDREKADMRVRLDVNVDLLADIATGLNNIVQMLEDDDDLDDLVDPARQVMSVMESLEAWLVEYRAVIGALVG